MPGSEPAGDGSHHVGPLAGFPLNACKIVQVAGREVGIIRTEREVFAIANRCPHMGGGICYGTVTGVMEASTPEDLRYDENEKAMRCPWHGWEFLLSTGMAVGGITNRRLRRFTLRVAGGEVYLLLRAPRPDGDAAPGDAAACGDAAQDDAAHEDTVLAGHHAR